MKIIGITGPTGAGKTTALHALEALGGAVIDADAVYHRLLAGDSALKEALVGRFGPGILSEGGEVERKRLGAIVFSDPAALADLNDLTHGFIVRALRDELDWARQAGCPAAALDAVRLIESGLVGLCDAVVGILAPSEVRVRRIMVRDGISESYARSRVEAQPGDGFYRAHCSYILENGEQDGPEALYFRAKALFSDLLSGEAQR